MKKLTLLFAVLVALTAPSLAYSDWMLGALTNAITRQLQGVVSPSSSPQAVRPANVTDNSLVGDPYTLQSEPLCVSQYVNGAAPRILTAQLAEKTKLGCFNNFTIMHSGLTRTALWSAEHLTRASLSAAAKLPREDSFRAEERLPPNERAELSDYSRSGYDRGHLAPNADEPTKTAQWQSFSLMNIIPQNSDNNRTLHGGIEAATRTLAKRHGELFVITGPLFIGSPLHTLHNRVIIPTHIFKAIFNPSTGQAAAYLEKNAPGMDYQVISITQLERMSGIDFFPSLPEQVKAVAGRLPVPTPHNH